MLNINSTIDLDVKSFLRWWTSELSYLVPEKIKHFINDRQGYIIVSFSADNLSLDFYHQGQYEHLAIIERGANGLSDYQALFVSDERLAKARCLLRLNANQAIQTQLSLPAAVKGNLLQVVGYELDKYSPFKAEQVYFSVRQLPESEPGQIHVQVIITPKEHLDSLYEEAIALGMSPLIADCAVVPNNLDDNSHRYNLLPDKLRPKTSKIPTLIYSGLATTLLLLLMGVLILPVWMENETVTLLAERVKSIEKDAKKIKSMQAEVTAFRDQTQKLIDHKTSLPPMIVMLNELSSLIKDDTWIAYAQYADGHLQIQGESPSASELISVLEESAIFANARFVSPVTQDNVSKFERFQITVDLTKQGSHENKRSK